MLKYSIFYLSPNVAQFSDTFPIPGAFVMPYHIDTDRVTLDEVKKRIKETDLVPSRVSLLENIDCHFDKLKKCGMISFAALRKELKHTKNIPLFAKRSGVNANYLTLLRREIEGYIPKAYPLHDFDWISENARNQLNCAGVKTSVHLANAFATHEGQEKILKAIQGDKTMYSQLQHIVNLLPVQWMSPVVVRMMLEAGYTNAKQIAEADVNELCDTLDSINKKHLFFNGKIGLRDVNRLVKAAMYV